MADLSGKFEATDLSSLARLHVDRAEALLPLLSPSRALRDIEASLLDLRELDASSEGTEWSPLVSDDWLANEAQRSRGAQRRSQRGTPPRPVD